MSMLQNENFESLYFFIYGHESYRGLFCIVRWPGLLFAVMGPSILSKGVKTSPTITQLGLVCAQIMPRLPGVCLWQAELFPMSYDRQI